MPPSPRLRADYLLLGEATAQRCLEAFSTRDGAVMYTAYPNIVSKAATIFPELLALLDASIPADLIAFQVTRFLDDGYAALAVPETITIDDLLTD